MKAALGAMLLLAPLPASAQGTLEDYRRAATISQRFANLTTGLASAEDWIGQTHQAVYRVTVPGGSRFVRVDAEQWTKQPAFDHAAVAKSLSSAAGQPYTEITLPFASISVVDNGAAFEGDATGSRYRCTIATSLCARVGAATTAGAGQGGGGGGGRGQGANTARCGAASPAPPGAARTEVFSPDCRTVAFIQNYNVAIRPAPASTTEGGGRGGRGGDGGGAGNPAPNHTLLSTDGSEGDAYLANSIVWSPDSKKLVAYRQKAGYNRVPYYVQSSPADQVQPKLVPYGQAPGNFGGGVYRKAGDILDSNQPAIFDIETKRQILVDRTLFPNPYAISRAVWRKDNGAYSFQYNQRGHMIYRVLEVDASTGTVRPMVDEVTKSFFMYSDQGHNFAYDVGANCRLAQGGGCDSYAGGELVWASERDGWNHLYLLDGRTGNVKHQITKGHWVVRGVDSVDVANRQIYFRAGGMNADQDPYFIHYYRINFDGTGLVAYTEADGSHTVTWSPDHQYYIDSYSRVDLPTVVELKRASDRRTLSLEKGDMSAAVKAGFRPPEVFVSKARDGTTDIWGIVVKPVTFDPKKKYPVIEQIYAGPHGSFVPKTWGGGQSLVSLAEIGFVLVQIDGMGTSNRSKAFHDVAWKNIADAGFPDRILWHQAVNKKYPWYDITRVGIYGTSAGGQNAAGAVFFHPEFYDVAVANSGCHDNRMDKIWWNEAWMGEIGPHYESNSNVTAAKNLKGHLYLTVGELDTNVDPSSTMQVANALIAAGKDFDLLVVPNGGHGATGLDGTRKRNDFFVRWLMGENPPDWNSGISLRSPGAGAPSGGSGGFDFPAEEPAPRGFFDEDPTFTYPMYWWF
ncbi:MAG: prolyl oligopeptidase family serine peptidase [Gemmatimonadaceae bacterium]|nr:prolyl oligopeptidase family serine peptidase [Gemmatimonadaceae bacterium]